MTKNKDDMSNSMSDSTRDGTPKSGVGRKVGEGAGGLTGIASGAAIGSIGGPVGTVIGAIAGAVGGWWTGKQISDVATSYTDSHDATYRNHFEGQSGNMGGQLESYDRARPAYQLGHLASQNPDYRGKSFDQVEGDLSRGWNADAEKQVGYSWNDARGAVAEGYARGGEMGGEQQLTRSEEELIVGKRQVQAGEVGLKKTVETEHVSKSVPLMHEEVEIERHPVNADSAQGNVEIGEQHIRIPLSAEEAVVGKRVVAKEEVVVAKHAVEDTRNVEGDIRKERIDVDKSGRGDATSDQSGRL